VLTPFVLLPSSKLRMRRACVLEKPMAGGNFCGLELLHIHRPNGSPISSLRLAAGSKSLAT
jgi:hypothetical protein